MKATGMTRKIDDLGRIVIPKELRKAYNMNVGDMMEIYTETNGIILHKYEVSCAFCAERENLVEYNGLNICKTCAENIGNIFANSKPNIKKILT